MKKIIVFLSLLIFAASTAYAQLSMDKLKGMFNKGQSKEDTSANSQIEALNKKRAAQNVPTGFMYREFTIRQVNLGGKWDNDSQFTPHFGFKAGYKYMQEDNYKQSLTMGTTELGGPFKPFASKMKKICNEDTKPGAKVTVRLYDKDPQWSIYQDKYTARITHRELYFQCLAEGERGH